MAAPHVLLAEDSTPLAESLRVLLLRAGFTVTLAHDGWQAAQALRQIPVDIFVTDYEMPGLTGSHLCFLLRDSPELAQLPVIMITGKGGDHNLKWLREEHRLVAVLEKPVKPQELIELISTSCCGR